ncbi:hypothetical protein HUO13_33110 [Saccharopolyspora erythraea]|uniref:DUF6879 family protein n=1 Tax=Saccharopolyspora erythraea TaxID=1836 RepID=UPI001BA503CB|nr:DUF6879 family protein [Saccharopolyspora erythraea]QUH04978.1 hypothetical protein HUO13_33110 [Saccharopolyspora erythraea]
MAPLDEDHFARHLQNYERSAWRFEVQPAYTSPDENLDLYLAGEPKPEHDNEDWHRSVCGFVAAGKTIGRVRVVRRPLTDYQRYQFDWIIPDNVAAGEDVRILDLTDLDLALPDQDFWLFDDAIVVHLDFDPGGVLTGIEQLEDADVAKYLRWRDLALRHAVPFAEHG